MTVQQAQKKAHEVLDGIVETGRAPGPDKRNRDERDLTLGEAQGAYRHDLVHRKRPAKASSLKSYDKAVRKLAAWKSKRINDLLDEENRGRLRGAQREGPTTAEPNSSLIPFATVSRRTERHGSSCMGPLLGVNDTVRYRAKHFAG